MTEGDIAAYSKNISGCRALGKREDDQIYVGSGMAGSCGPFLPDTDS
jgi:hypothetical protein